MDYARSDAVALVDGNSLLYFTRRATVVYVLICGGDKAGQQRDIKRAKQLLKLLPKE